jgi:hypothetical protein
VNPSNQIDVAGVSSPVRKKYFTGWIILVLLLALCAARAEGPDDDYLAIYGTIEQADALSASGKTDQARAKYLEAQRALIEFKRENPNWSVKVVAYRSKYVAEKIAATAPNAVAPVSSPAAAVKTPAESPVKLLDAGSEPRTVLRLHPAVGDKQTMTMTMKMAMTMSAGDKPMPAMEIPAMVMTMDVEVKDISTNGEITYGMVFSDATVADDTNTMPAIAAAMKSSLDTIRGMTGTGQLSDHGMLKGLEMKLPAGADPQMSQTMGQMKESFSSSSLPLPEEAVGPGAKWEYKTKLKSQGMTIDQTATYELVSVDGDRLTLRITITQSAAGQKIQNPTMPGLAVDLNKMTGAGTGDSTLDLGHIMPVSATIAEDMETIMGVNVGQQKQTMDMKMNMKVSMESK